jgi:hypothetical protein
MLDNIFTINYRISLIYQFLLLYDTLSALTVTVVKINALLLCLQFLTYAKCIL